MIIIKNYLFKERRGWQASKKTSDCSLLYFGRTMLIISLQGSWSEDGEGIFTQPPEQSKIFETD